MSEQFNVLIHSYCLMTNHYHLILETPEGNLSRAIQWLNVSSAAYYNRKHHFVGHLFRGRFKAVLVDAGEYLGALSRKLSGQALGQFFGGISGANITMPFNKVAQALERDRKLAKNIKLLQQK